MTNHEDDEQTQLIEGEVRTEFVDGSGADAFDIVELIDRGERAVSIPIIQDGLRFARADVWEGFECGFVGAVEVDKPGCSART